MACAACRLSALLSALDITFASTAPLWVDNIRGQHGPPAHRGYRMYLHKTENKQGGKVGAAGCLCWARESLLAGHDQAWMFRTCAYMRSTPVNMHSRGCWDSERNDAVYAALWRALHYTAL